MGASHRRDVPVAGLLRDSIVGITCFPDPLPRGRKRTRGCTVGSASLQRLTDLGRHLPRRSDLPVIECPHCGRRTFKFAHRAMADRCPACGARLSERHDTAAIEAEVRDRLYGGRRADSAPRPSRLESSGRS